MMAAMKMPSAAERPGPDTIPTSANFRHSWSAFLRLAASLFSLIQGISDHGDDRSCTELSDRLGTPGSLGFKTRLLQFLLFR